MMIINKMNRTKINAAPVIPLLFPHGFPQH